MRSKLLIMQAALAAVALLFSSAALGSLTLATDCTDTSVIPGAEANELPPDLCANGDLANDSPTAETAGINSVFQGLEDPFYFVARTGDCEDCLPGFDLNAGISSDPDWNYWFELLTPYAGQTVDFALLVKQPIGGGGTIKDVAYYWEDLVLDVDGFYNSFNSDYSHISAFIRGVDVSEPAPLALLGIGLLGVALLRRRSS